MLLITIRHLNHWLKIASTHHTDTKDREIEAPVPDSNRGAAGTLALPPYIRPNGNPIDGVVDWPLAACGKSIRLNTSDTQLFSTSDCDISLRFTLTHFTAPRGE